MFLFWSGQCFVMCNLQQPGVYRDIDGMSTGPISDILTLKRQSRGQTRNDSFNV